MASEKSKILVVGATGHLGRHVVAASARLGHPTFALVRDTAPSDPAKAALLKSFQNAGVTLLKGDLADYGSLVSAAKLADVVISTVGVRQIADQSRLIDAIKEAGNVKRFVPSEFGLDADRSAAVEPIRSLIINSKAALRRAVEASGVPYTYAWTGYFFSYGLPGIGQVLAQSPPTDDKAAVILGDGDSKVSYVDEGGHRHLHGAGRRRPARREQDAVHQAAAQHAVAQRAPGAVGGEDGEEDTAGASRRGRCAQADPRGSGPAEQNLAVNRACGAYQEGTRVRDRQIGWGGCQRAVPGREVHHGRRLPQQAVALNLIRMHFPRA